MANNGPGGFVPNPLPSPAPSQASSTATFRFTDDLPNSRSHPLQPGSQKETAFINYVDTRILNINRRYAKKFTGEIEEGAGRGYDNFTDVVRDLQSVLDVVWVSGTRKCICSFPVLYTKMLNFWLAYVEWSILERPMSLR